MCVHFLTHEQRGGCGAVVHPARPEFDSLGVDLGAFLTRLLPAGTCGVRALGTPGP
jgi:hypothetical protein